jgi:hypothetical protein
MINSLESNGGERQYIVELQMVILKLGQINTKNQTFYAEFYLDATWSDKIDHKQVKNRGSNSYDPKNHFQPAIIISNTIEEHKNEVSYIIHSQTEQNENEMIEITERRHVSGIFWQRFDFKYFPIDVQSLQIEIASKIASSKVVLVESVKRFNCLSPTAFMAKQQWVLHNFITTSSSIVANDISMENNSNFKVTVSVSRIPLHYFCNIFFIIFIITSFEVMRFVVKCNEPGSRLILSSLILLTLTTFKFSIMDNNLPQTTYLTSIDKYFLSSFVFIFLQCVYDGVIGVLANSSSLNSASLFTFYDLLAFVSSIIIIILINLTLLIWIFLFAYKNRARLYRQSKLTNSFNSARLFTIYSNDIQSNVKFEINKTQNNTNFIDDENNLIISL